MFPKGGKIGWDTVLFTALAALFPVLIISTYVDTFRKAFNQHKDKLVKMIDCSFCSHGGKCDCKDKFLKYMNEKEGIKLF